MKRYLLLAGMVVCLLSACGAQEEPSANVPLPDPDASVQLPSPPPQERILYTLSESDREETVQTDTGVVLRGVEIEADAILMAKNIDAIYSADPRKDPNAVRYTELTYAEALAKNLKATDITAMALAMDNDMTMVCFGLAEENSIIRVVRGEEIGTTVKNKF